MVAIVSAMCLDEYMNMMLDYPATEGRTVTEAHARICAERGHATWTVDGTDTGRCPRCGEVTIPATTTRVVRDVFAGHPEIRTSYDNQRGLAARDLGGDVLCIHHATLNDGCRACRTSNSVLIPA
jgi:hypothetical protein